MIDSILTNRFTSVALILAALGGLMSDALGSGYWGVISITIAGILFAYYDESKRKKIYAQANISIPLVFNISNPADSKTALDALFHKLQDRYPNHKKNLKNFFSIVEDNLIFEYDGDIFDEKRFVDFLKVTKHDIKKIDARTPQNIHFHIVYIGPISNAIMIGTMLGTEGLTLYQYNKSSDSYATTVEIKSRAYKEHINEFKLIKKETYGEIKDTVTVAIDFSSHKVALGKLDEPIVHLQSTLGATIRKPEDFIRANQEIYAVINELQQDVKHIKLAYSMPTTVAIMLGMSMQNYWDVELTQLDDSNYKTVLTHLNDIKYYF